MMMAFEAVCLVNEWDLGFSRWGRVEWKKKGDLGEEKDLRWCLSHENGRGWIMRSCYPCRQVKEYVSFRGIGWTEVCLWNLKTSHHLKWLLLKMKRKGYRWMEECPRAAVIITSLAWSNLLINTAFHPLPPPPPIFQAKNNRAQFPFR